jgi:DNA-binding NtrC family response regulator
VGRDASPTAEPTDVLLVVRHEGALARALQIDLRRAFHDEGYRAECRDSADDALEVADELKRTGQRLALLVFEGIAGVELASRVRRLFPDVRTILLVEHAQLRSALDAMNSGDVDYFFVLPLQEAENQVVPVAADLLVDWRRWAAVD